MPSKPVTAAVKKRNARRRGAPSSRTMAQKADRHDLYQRSVQSVDAEIDFVDDTFFALRGRRAALLREDFCGTANTSCEWVRRRRANRAIGVDLDPDVQAWGIEHNISALPPAARARIELRTQDVLTVDPGESDIVLAMNFSYWIFKTRATMIEYFRNVHRTLAHDGVFFLDAYGGYEAQKVLRESRKISRNFTYIWQQASFNPINHDMSCRIHFRFADGSRMNNAFEYHWRLWSLPEIREMLLEAGFARTIVYWEGEDPKSDEGDGNFQPTEQGTADAGWICYVAGIK